MALGSVSADLLPYLTNREQAHPQGQNCHCEGDRDEDGQKDQEGRVLGKYGVA
jgi:hypothetical protein